MRRFSAFGGMVVVLMVLLGNGSVFAQTGPDARTITHVNSAEGHFDKLHPGVWLWTAVGSTREVDIEEDQSTSATALYLRREGNNGLREIITIVPNRQFLNVRDLSSLAQGGRDSPITDMWFECSPATPANTKCTCDLTKLRPLQGAAGLGEVAKKAKDVEDQLRVEMDELENDPIKVVRGPDDALYVIDHHHGALAFLDDQRSKGTCELTNTPPGSPYTKQPESFFLQLQEYNKIRLKNGKGEPIVAAALPKTLKELPDDPYRTLAWMVRKEDGYCRSKMNGNTDFAEFQWADWLRAQPTLPMAAVAGATNPEQWNKKKKDRVNAQKPILTEALRLALGTGQGQNALPGYRKAGEPVQGCNP